MLKILPDDSMIGKFGATMREVKKIVTEAWHENVSIQGISIYIPSRGLSITQYERAFEKCVCIINHAANFGFDIKVIDIGEDFEYIFQGGCSHASNEKFTTNYTRNSEPSNFKRNTQEIRRLINCYFGQKDITIYGDMGVNVAEDSVYIATRIVAQKVMKTGDHHYYINGGMY